jgi:hypothetical protein
MTPDWRVLPLSAIERFALLVVNLFLRRESIFVEKANAFLGQTAERRLLLAVLRLAVGVIGPLTVSGCWVAEYCQRRLAIGF